VELYAIRKLSRDALVAAQNDMTIPRIFFEKNILKSVFSIISTRALPKNSVMGLKSIIGKKSLCPVETFCGVQRYQKDLKNKKPTNTEVVQVLCMGEGEMKGKKTIGNKNWFNPNQHMTQKVIDKLLGDRAKYMNQFTVTDHPNVRKTDIEKLELVVKDDVYAVYLKDFKPEEEKSDQKTAAQQRSRGKNIVEEKGRKGKSKSEEASGSQ